MTIAKQGVGNVLQDEQELYANSFDIFSPPERERHMLSGKTITIHSEIPISNDVFNC